MNSVKNPIDLINRIDARDKEVSDKRKKRVEEFQQTKPSPQYFKSKALEKLKRIVNDNLSWENFKDYIAANRQEFSDDEYNEIKYTLEQMLKSKEDFDRWTETNLTPLSEK